MSLTEGVDTPSQQHPRRLKLSVKLGELQSDPGARNIL